MNVLVTGAAGFIGSNLVDALLRRGDEVVGLDNFDPHYDPARKRRNLTAAMADPRFKLIEADILDASCLRAVTHRWRFHGIVHLAARVSNRHSLVAADADGYDAVNAGGTAILLAACAGVPPRSFVFVSTGNVYDCTAPAPFREGVTPDRPRTPYSRSKKTAECLVLEAASSNGLQATVLRLFTVYGPRQRPDMVHYRFASALLEGKPLTLIGAGADRRDYIHVSDACAAILACLDRPAAAEIINIGSGCGTTLDNLLALLARCTSTRPLIHRQEAPCGDTHLMLADVAKAEQRLGWRPTTKLEKGLEDFIAWFQSPENSPAIGGAPNES
jgi:UDP-glucuronate 4-epimerase